MITQRFKSFRAGSSTFWLGLSALGLAWLGIAAPVQASLINVANPNNVLAGPGRTITVSSAIVGFPGLDDPTAMIDNFATANDADGSFLFGQHGADPSPNTLSISGFNGGFDFLRIFTAADPTRMPTNITIRSSTSLVTTLNAGDYETFLGNFTFSQPPGSAIPLTAYPVVAPPPASARGYFELQLASAAPGGTRSLYMELGDPTSGTRIYELQALAIPEPSSLFLFASGGWLLWRIRSQRR